MVNSCGKVKVAAVTSERPAAGIVPVTVAFGVKTTLSFSCLRYAFRVGMAVNFTGHGLEAQVTGVVVMTPELEARSSTVPVTGKLGMAVLRVGRACKTHFWDSQQNMPATSEFLHHGMRACTINRRFSTFRKIY